MGVYIDAIVTPVPKKKKAAYLRIARTFGKVWLDHGALNYRECMADDVSWGKRTSFPRSVKLKRGEVVWHAWTVYKSRKHRDQVNTKAMKDPRVAAMMKPGSMPFDIKRMYFGGFKTMLEM